MKEFYLICSILLLVLNIGLIVDLYKLIVDGISTVINIWVFIMVLFITSVIVYIFMGNFEDHISRTRIKYETFVSTNSVIMRINNTSTFFMIDNENIMQKLINSKENTNKYKIYKQYTEMKNGMELTNHYEVISDVDSVVIPLNEIKTYVLQ